MKIIFVVSAMNGGGAERVVATLANRYIQNKDDITILMIAGNNSVYSLNKGIKCFSIGGPSKGNPVIQIKRFFLMRKFFRAHRDSKIVSFSTRINLFTILSVLGLKIPVIVSERNDPNRYNHIRLRNGVYWLGAKAGVRFVFQTVDAQKCFPQIVQKSSIIIVNPLRSNLPQAEYNINDFIKRENKIAAVGRLEEQKNYGLLLQAFMGFYQKHPEYELHIFGEGSLSGRLKKWTEENGISKKVVWEGFCENVLEKIKTYKMYVLSSDYEGIPNSLMEAMAIGLPCISTDCPIGGPALCIENGRNGLLVPVGNVEKLYNAMLRLAEDDFFAENLGRNAIIVRQQFGEEQICGQWYQYIKSK